MALGAECEVASRAPIASTVRVGAAALKGFRQNFVQVLPNRNGLIVEYKLSCCGATSRAINDNSL